MGIWCNINGTVNVERARNVSVRKIVSEVLEGEDFSVSTKPTDNIFVLELNVSLERDSDISIRKVKKIRDAFDENKIKYDLEVNVRFIG